METRDAESGRGSLEALSRRSFIKGATALAAAASVPKAFGQQPTGAPPGTVWLYIGTYTNVASGGSGGNGAACRPRGRTHQQGARPPLPSTQDGTTCMRETKSLVPTDR